MLDHLSLELQVRYATDHIDRCEECTAAFEARKAFAAKHVQRMRREWKTRRSAR